MFTLVVKDYGCPDCDRLKRWLETIKIIEGTYSILVASETHFDWRPLCREYNVRAVPALVNLDTREVITGVDNIMKTLKQYKEEE